MPVRRIALMLVIMLLAANPVAGLADDDVFQRTWARTDKPVTDGQVSRTWMWGTESFTGTISEQYLESPGGTRDVQYFDKARMEISDPSAADDGLWYVTNGLLVVELISGKMQIGHDRFEPRFPAVIPVAGDRDDPHGPTYATFAALLDAKPAAFRESITERLDRNGQVTHDRALGALGITTVHTDDVTNHAIAEPFWAFMNSTGLVWQDGELVEAALFEDPIFATGRPITEPYWATVKVANTIQDVLVQCFERRCLTYTPDNPEGWQVEAGNVGRHYHDWRHQQTTPGPGLVSVSSVRGEETSAGSIDGDTRYGATFVGSAIGDVPGTFRATLNYTPPYPGAGVANTIVGGTWSITHATGAVTGIFQGGVVQWDEANESATINAIMKVMARSGAFDNLPREARLTGALSYTAAGMQITATLAIYP